MSQQGAIIEYGGPKHTEHAFIYVSDQWSELLSLLESPCAFLRMKGSENSPIAWELLESTTVIVEPMNTTHDTEIRSRYLLDLAIPAARTRVAWEKADREEIRRSLIPGTFIVEFAAYTRTLWIRYWLPLPADIPPKRFKGQFVAPVTHAPISGLPVGNMHVDIKRDLGKTEKHRAQFILDYIEDGNRFTDDLNAMAEGDRLRNAAILAETGPGKPELQVTRNHQKETMTYKPMDELRRVVIEGMSIPELPNGYFVCIDGDTREDGQYILVGGVLVKCYVGTKPADPTPAIPTA